VDNVVLFDRREAEAAGPVKASRRGLELIRKIRDRRYDLVFDLFGNPRTALVTRLSGAKWRVGFDWRGRKRAYNVVVPSRADEIHEVDFNLDALRWLGIRVEETRPQVVVTPEAEAEADAFFAESGLQPGEVLAVNAAGGWATKRWPVPRFAEVARRVHEEFGLRSLILWGPGELDLAERLLELIGDSAVALPQTDLIGLAATLERCRLLLTNDSGPMHLAAAVGTPVVAIFGPTNPKLQGPYGEGHHVVRNEELDCLGCNLTRCEHRSCMVGLATDTVLETVRRALGERR
jgi:ADP-heptose:LPS heptosyltransferase